MTSPYSWHPPASTSTLRRFDPDTAARLADLGRACNTLAVSLAGVTAAGEAAEMRFSQLDGDDDGPPKTPFLRIAEDVTCRAALRAAATLTAHLTKMAITFAAQASAAVLRLTAPGTAVDIAATPAPSDFLRQPEAVLPPVTESKQGLADVDREALEAAYATMLAAAWRCRGENVEQFDDAEHAEPGLSAELAVSAHAYAVLLVSTGSAVSG